MVRSVLTAALLGICLAVTAGCGEGNPPGKLPDGPIPIIKDGPKGAGPPPKDGKQPSAAVD